MLHPWLKEQLSEVLAEIEKEHPRTELPPEAKRPACARWETWLGHPPRNPEPSLRIVLVLDNLAGHLSYDLVRWLFDYGVMPLYTPIGSSWLNMAESVQRIIMSRALAGQHPKNVQEVIDWLEQTVDGWNQNPTPFVWNGKRRRRRERARVRRLDPIRITRHTGKRSRHRRNGENGQMLYNKMTRKADSPLAPRRKLVH